MPHLRVFGKGVWGSVQFERYKVTVLRCALGMTQCNTKPGSLSCPEAGLFHLNTAVTELQTTKLRIPTRCGKLGV